MRCKCAGMRWLEISSLFDAVGQAQRVETCECTENCRWVMYPSRSKVTVPVNVPIPSFLWIVTALLVFLPAPPEQLNRYRTY